MSLINEYRSTQAAIEELQSRLAKLSDNDGLKKEIEFEEKLRGLMGAYGKSLKDIIAIIDPQATRGTGVKATSAKKPRKVKVYTNPETNEVIETKGGNHKVLKEWKAKYGAAVVETWAA